MTISTAWSYSGSDSSPPSPVPAPAELVAVGGAAFEQALDVVRLALLLELLDDAVHFVIRDERAMHAHRCPAPDSMSPIPSSDSAPIWSRIVRESIFDDTWNAIRVGTLALIRPVITSTDGRCVARIRWMPAARAFCAIRAISSSTFLPTTIIRSASSSITTTMFGRRPSGSGSSGVRLNGFGSFSSRFAASSILLL